MTTQAGPEFNISLYKFYEANRWKFLDELEPHHEVGFFLQSPVPVLSLTISYIVFVCLIGPLLMRNREPFQLKNLIRFYNLIMVLLAGFLFVRLYDAFESFSTIFDCTKTFTFTDECATKVYRIGSFILLVRLSEYLDTIFFILRKKQSQVTFLHIFHHSFVPVYAYWLLRTAPSRFNVYILLINSFIHVLMYFYYFLATFQQRDSTNGTKPKRLSLIMQIVTKLLMFKKYMTQLQILQFISLGSYTLWAMIQPEQCGIPWTYIIANFLLAFGFLGLFVHFYLNVYKAAARQKRE